jgi:hypothetical protein
VAAEAAFVAVLALTALAIGRPSSLASVDDHPAGRGSVTAALLCDAVLIVSAEISYSRLLNTLGGVAGVAAVAAALVYGTGGLVLMLRLGLRRLPSTTAVPQLPREFLVSVGLQIVVPAVLVGGAALLVSRLRWSWAAIAFLVVYLGIGVYLVAKPPFPAKACLAADGEIAGVLIGESDSRTYLGDLSSRHPRRIITIPAARIETVLVGGSESALNDAVCPPTAS